MLHGLSSSHQHVSLFILITYSLALVHCVLCVFQSAGQYTTQQDMDTRSDTMQQSATESETQITLEPTTSKWKIKKSGFPLQLYQTNKIISGTNTPTFFHI